MASEWIPVTERLPEDLEEVIICYDDDGDQGVVGVGIRYPGPRKGDGYWQNGNGWELEHVTHWMPLPDPPRTEPDADPPLPPAELYPQTWERVDAHRGDFAVSEPDARMWQQMAEAALDMGIAPADRDW